MPVFAGIGEDNRLFLYETLRKIPLILVVGAGQACYVDALDRIDQFRGLSQLIRLLLDQCS